VKRFGSNFSIHIILRKTENIQRTLEKSGKPKIEEFERMICIENSIYSGKMQNNDLIG